MLIIIIRAFRTFTKGRSRGARRHRPDSAPPGKFELGNHSNGTIGEAAHPMMTYHNSPQFRRYMI